MRGAELAPSVVFGGRWVRCPHSRGGSVAAAAYCLWVSHQATVRAEVLGATREAPLHKGVLLRTPVLSPSATPVKESVVVDRFAVGGTAAVLSINTDQRSTSSYEMSDRTHFTAPLLPATSARCQSSAPALWGGREPAVPPRARLRARGVRR
ncbi:LOW QUALITY PROTEIN: hypothetical protein Q4I30_005896 [Leishmania utingensis]|uniref:Uncharacterized protein n=1 Tax=Leishmania utingensis TaxID=653362 RepID=A0AAW3A833_9TRYP